MYYDPFEDEDNSGSEIEGILILVRRLTKNNGGNLNCLSGRFYRMMVMISQTQSFSALLLGTKYHGRETIFSVDFDQQTTELKRQ